MKGILVNIFGGIMRCDVIAEGVVEATRAVGLEGAAGGAARGDERGGGPRDPPRERARHRARDGHGATRAQKIVAAAGEVRREHPRRQGHAAPRPGDHRRRRARSTRWRAGRTARTSWAGSRPASGGTDVEGIPVFDTVADAVAKTGANATHDLRPAPVRRGRDPRGGGRRDRARSSASPRGSPPSTRSG